MLLVSCRLSSSSHNTNEDGSAKAFLQFLELNPMSAFRLLGCSATPATRTSSHTKILKASTSIGAPNCKIIFIANHQVAFLLEALEDAAAKAASLHLRSNSSRTPSYLCISIILEPRRSTRQLLHLVVNLPSGHKQSSFAASKRLKAPPRHSQCALIVSSLGLLISKKPNAIPSIVYNLAFV